MKYYAPHYRDKEGFILPMLHPYRGTLELCATEKQCLRIIDEYKSMLHELSNPMTKEVKKFGFVVKKSEKIPIADFIKLDYDRKQATLHTHCINV